MDLHAAQIQGFFDIPVDHLSASPVIDHYIASLGYSPEESVVVSPDEGSIKRAAQHVKTLGGTLAIIDKRRYGNRVEQANLIGGPIDDADRTWFNGTLIGETQLDKFPDAYSRKRSYPIPAEAIRFGEENEILIQVYDRWGDGGVTGPLNIVCGKQDIRNEWSPYVQDLNLYDGDAFHNW